MVTRTCAADPDGVCCSYTLGTRAGPTAPIRVLCLSGEVDLSTLHIVRGALDAATGGAAGRPPAYLVIDVSGLTFCSVRGLALLHHPCSPDGGAVSCILCGLAPHLARVAAFLWPDGESMRLFSASSAVTTLRIEQTHRAVPHPRDQSPDGIHPTTVE